jgi:GNAT superfamily N-acetyltransferase
MNPGESASTIAPRGSTEKAAALGMPFVLRDGSRVRIRQWRAADRELLVGGFYRLSATSSYRRFLSASPVLTDQMVQVLTDVDHRDHEAMVALGELGREGLGIAHYVRSLDRPGVAEVALTVIDDWQGRGLGTLLLEVISARARQEGIKTFTALMLAENRRMRDLLERLGPVRVIDERRGTVEVEVAIPAAGAAPELRELLRISARHQAGSSRAGSDS